MKKLTSILFLMLMATGLASAQPPVPEAVDPGSKGQLPTLPTVASQSGVYPGLWLGNVGYDFNAFTGSYRWRADFSFEGEYFDFDDEPIADYYDFQKKNSDGGWDIVATLASNAVGYDVYNSGIYRLRYRAGKLAGKVSNEVSVDFPGGGTCISRYSSWWRQNYEDTPLVGEDVLGDLAVNVTSHIYSENKNTNVTIDDGYYRYQWYRKNPNTGQMTRIQGATMLHYRPTIDDVGYALVLEVTGDGTHCNFLVNIPVSVVKYPVMASLDYVGPDGFVLNTDHVVNADDFVMNMQFYGEEELPQGPMEISQREPGKYVFRCNLRDEYDSSIVEHANPGVFICFVYLIEQDQDDDGVEETVVWHREAQVMSDRFSNPLVVKPVYNGEPVATTVEAYAPNIDGVPTLVASEEAVDENGVTFYVSSLGIGCYVKALRTENTSETYYPSAQLWTEATPVISGFDEEWNPVSVTIDMKPVPPALTGTGVIEGTVTVASSSNAPHRASADASGISVYLKKKGGAIIASEETTATGSYRFEKVPLGTYEVLVNIDGCTQPSPTEVTLTSNNKTVTDIDYVVENNSIKPAGEAGNATGINHVSSSDSSQGMFYDLQGRRIYTNKLGRGLYIQNGKKVLVK